MTTIACGPSEAKIRLCQIGDTDRESKIVRQRRHIRDECHAKAERRQDDVDRDRQQIIGEPVGIIVQVALGIGFRIVLVLYELERGDDQWRAVGQAGKAEQPFQIADDFASEGANVVAADKNAERHDAAEHYQRRPSQHFSKSGHLPLLGIPDPTRCTAFRADRVSWCSV